MHMCLLMVMTEDLKCINEGACVNGCLTVSNQDNSHECASCQYACDHYGMYVTHADNQYLKCLKTSIRNSVIGYTTEMF